jgi:Spy/CpxP family protein refolding chaperone
MRSIVAALALMATAPVAAHAQATAALPTNAKLSEVVASEVQKITKRLKLTPDQQATIKSLLQEEASKYDALDQEYMKKEDAIEAEYTEKLRATLTPEQVTEWQKIKGEYAAKLQAASKKY